MIVVTAIMWHGTSRRVRPDSDQYQKRRCKRALCTGAQLSSKAACTCSLSFRQSRCPQVVCTEGHVEEEEQDAGVDPDPIKT